MIERWALIDSHGQIYGVYESKKEAEENLRDEKDRVVHLVEMEDK